MYVCACVHLLRVMCVYLCVCVRIFHMCVFLCFCLSFVHTYICRSVTVFSVLCVCLLLFLTCVCLVVCMYACVLSFKLYLAISNSFSPASNLPLYGQTDAQPLRTICAPPSVSVEINSKKCSQYLIRYGLDGQRMLGVEEDSAPTRLHFPHYVLSVHPDLTVQRTQL